LTNQQMIDLAYVVLSKEPIFQQDIRLWNRKPPADKTWDNMLEHFRNAQTDLNALPTAGELYHQGPHHANTVMTMVDMVTQRLQELYPPVEETTVVAPVPSPQANVAVQSRESSLAVREAALLAQMTEMLALMQTNTTNSNRNTRGRGGGGRTNNRPTGGRGRGGASPRQYCWSHGYCAHGSAECNNQLPGHQTTATTTNMQGGSTNNCFWITPA